MQRKVSASVLPKRLVAHTRLEDDAEVEALYEFGRMLGQGSFGSVNLATHSATGAEWAIKSIDKKKAGSSGARMLEFEIAILKRVSHDFIVNLKEVFETPKRSYLVLEFCRGGTLQQHYLTPDHKPAFSQRDVAVIIQRLAGAVAYLHENDIAHRDLKLDNIMLAPTPEDPLVIKVTDFGLCAVKGKDMPEMAMVCGTPSYMAPEVLADNGTYSPLCDIWSTGVILYNLLCGQLPFRGDAEKSLEDRIQEAKVVFSKDWATIDPAAQNLVVSCLKADPARRITAKEILDHTWLGGGSGMGTVLDMMKQHAITERAAAGDTLAPPSPVSTPARVAADRVRTPASKARASPTPSPARPLPGYMRPTKASGTPEPSPAPLPAHTRVVRLPSSSDK